MKRIISLVVVVLSIFAFAGCTKKEPNVPVSDIVGDIKKQIAEDMKAAGVPEDRFKDGQLPGYMEIDFTSEEAEQMGNLFNKEDLAEGIGLMQMMNVKADEVIVLKAADNSKVPALKEDLEKHYESVYKIWEQYLPQEFEKVKNHILKTNGNYLILIIYENPEKIEEIFDNALK